MAPYTPAEPHFFFCFSNRNSKHQGHNTDTINETCVKSAAELGQDADGVLLNKMPDLNRDGLTDLVTFNSGGKAHFHLNTFSDTSQNSMLETAFESSSKAGNDIVELPLFACQEDNGQAIVGDVSPSF